eukprot:IDg21887t1
MSLSLGPSSLPGLRPSLGRDRPPVCRTPSWFSSSFRTSPSFRSNTPSRSGLPSSDCCFSDHYFSFLFLALRLKRKLNLTFDGLIKAYRSHPSRTAAVAPNTVCPRVARERILRTACAISTHRESKNNYASLRKQD